VVSRKKKKTVKKSSSGKNKKPAKKAVTKTKSVKSKAKRKTVKQASLFKRMFLFCFKWGVVSGIWGIVAVISMLVFYGYNLPDIQNINVLEAKPPIEILDRHGSVIGRFGGVQGQKITVDDLPAYLSAAVVAVEDRRFYDHFGLDIKGFARAMGANVMAGSFVQGGSTLTQQLAKNLFLSPQKTIKRKVQEAMLAVWLEHEFNKDEILSIYLNHVYFGAGAYGIDAAARTYFNKSATQVNLWEAAMLAGLLKAPSRYSPSAHPNRAVKRTKVVLKTMFEAGYIDKNQMQKPKGRYQTQIHRPNYADPNRYFVDWVMAQAESFVDTSATGMQIKTTFDPDFQEAAHASISRIINDHKKDKNMEQAAVVVMSPTGQVYAMVGGYDYQKSQFNRATQARRQIGSLFKPIVYLTAIQKGYRATDLILDAPLTGDTYQPKNFNDKYYGDVSLETALIKSLNTATVRLAKKIGLSSIFTNAEGLGLVQNWRRDMSAILGSNESSLLDLTSAYSVFANGGFETYPYAIKEIRDVNNVILYQREKYKPARVFKKTDIRKLNEMLRENVQNGTGRRAGLKGLEVFGKTGTSQQFRDAWFVGYTDNVTIGVWFGRDDNLPMKNVTGSRYPAIVFNQVLQTAVRDQSIKSYLQKEYKKNSPKEGFFSKMLDGLLGN